MKFDSEMMKVARQFYPLSLDRRLAELSSMDRHAAHVWLSYMSGLLGRPSLDRRTRMLVLVGQYALRDASSELGECIEAAVREGISPMEVFDAILHAYVFGGDAVLGRAASLAIHKFEEHGLTPESPHLAATPPLDSAARESEETPDRWSPSDRNHSQLEAMVEKYGWEAVNAIASLRPGSLDYVEVLDAVDTGFTELWLHAVWQGIYMRATLDERTRGLCIVGDMLALGEEIQLKRHIQGALRMGARPTEIREVILQSCHILGHPGQLHPALDDLLAVSSEFGRLEELIDQSGMDVVQTYLAQLGPNRQIVDPKE